MICAYLLHNHHFKESKDALKYYGDARTRNAKGVTIPSQRRYVLYYNHVLRHELYYTRTMVLLKRFEMLSESMFQNSTLSKYFVVLVIIQRHNQLFINGMYIVWCSGLMVCVLTSGLSSPGLSPGWGHCVVFFNLGKTLYFHSVSFYPDV